MQIQKNMLFTGDNLYILRGMNSETVDLIYLDPPFNSKRTYSAPIGSKAAGAEFKDMWSWNDVDTGYLESLVQDYPFLVRYIESIRGTHSAAMMAYATYMTQRLLELHRVLKPTGSLYLHVDPTASHYMKVILDQIFGQNNFQNEIIWYYKNASRGKKRLAKAHDVILWYSKSSDFIFVKDDILVPFESGMTQWRYERGGQTGKEPPKGKIPDDVISLPSLNTMSKERTGYPTQKPLALLERIINASSNKNDIVLDPFCGCATTCVAAQMLQRRWIGIDIEEQAASLLVERLSDDAGMFKDFVHINVLKNPELSPKRSDITETAPTPHIKETLYTGQNGVCNGCHNSFEARNLEIDHIVPKSRGGGDYVENYQLLCGNCNRIKGARPMEYLRIKIKARNALLEKEITFGD